MNHSLVSITVHLKSWLILGKNSTDSLKEFSFYPLRLHQIGIKVPESRARIFFNQDWYKFTVILIYFRLHSTFTLQNRVIFVHYFSQHISLLGFIKERKWSDGFDSPFPKSREYYWEGMFILLIWHFLCQSLWTLFLFIGDC